jgi:hypothetical protein
VIPTVDEHGDVVRGEHLDGRLPRRLGQAVGIMADEQWTDDVLIATVVADCLADAGEALIVEGCVNR